MKKFLLGLVLLTFLLSCIEDGPEKKEPQKKEDKKKETEDNFGYFYNKTSIGLSPPPTWLRGKFKPGVFSYKEQANKSTIEITSDDIIIDGKSFRGKFVDKKIYLDIGKRKLVGDNSNYYNDNTYTIYERTDFSKTNCYIYTFILSKDGQNLSYEIYRAIEDKAYRIRSSLYDKVKE